MNTLKKLSALLLAGLLPIAFTGCNNDDDNNGARGPANGGAFAGVVLNINPTITFGAGNSFIYANADGTDLNFPSTENLPDFTGTYTYTPSANFTTGEMRLDFTSENPDIDDLVLQFQSFVVSNAIITEFTAVVNGTSYPVTVTTGTLNQAPAPQGGGSGSYTDTTIPAQIEGSYTVYYFAPFGDPTEIPDDVDYEVGDQESFVINSDNTVTFAGRTLGSPRKYDSSSEIFIEDPTQNWWLAIEVDHITGDFRKFNLYRSPTGGTGNFIGQFGPEMPNNNGGGDNGGDNGGDEGGLNGSYTFTVNNVTNLGAILSPPQGPAPLPATGSYTITFSQNATKVTYRGNTFDLIDGGAGLQYSFSGTDQGTFFAATLYVNTLANTLTLDVSYTNLIPPLSYMTTYHMSAPY